MKTTAECPADVCLDPPDAHQSCAVAHNVHWLAKPVDKSRILAVASQHLLQSQFPHIVKVTIHTSMAHANANGLRQ